jgi:ubiquitin C-terminal hydrolase
MNTCLQNLIHSEDFIKRLISKKSSISRSTPISYYFFNLCQELSNSSRAVSPTKFKEKFGLKHHLFAGYGQNDTQEFCRVLLEDMNSELNEVKKRNLMLN